MLTTEEVAQIPDFAALPLEVIKRLAQRAGDVRLGIGEYAVSEGGERGLFAVLSGCLEVVKLFDGVERRLGLRKAGALFGEVPLALSSPFPAGYRAIEPSRVMQVDLDEYYRLCGASKHFAERIGALARERLGGLQSISAEQPKPRATLLGRPEDCARLTHFLTRNQISFEQLAPDSPDLAARWPDAPAVDGRVAVRLADGGALIAPEPRELADALGLQTRPKLGEYDVAIIGAGPAGLAAAVYGASEGLKTIVIEREAPGGQAGTSSRIENYLGFPSGVSGDELASRALRQARRLGAEILVTRQVAGVDPKAHVVTLDGGEQVRARALVLTTGVSWRRLETEGVDRLIGRGVFYGAARSEASAASGLDIFLIGAGNSAGQAALHLANHARNVTLMCRADLLERSMSHYLIEQLKGRANIDFRMGYELVAAYGQTKLEAIDIRQRDTGEVTRQVCGGLYIFIGADAETHWMPPEIARDPHGYVLTGEDAKQSGRWPLERDPFLLETSVPGVFASGDVRSSPVKRVAAAVGDGSMAIAFVHRHLAASS